MSKDDKKKDEKEGEKPKEKPKPNPKPKEPFHRPTMLKISLQSFFDGAVIEGCRLEVRSDSDHFFPCLGNHIWVDVKKHEAALHSARDKARLFAARQGGGGGGKASWGEGGGAGTSQGGGGGGLNMKELASLFEEGFTKAIAAVKSSEGTSSSKEVLHPFCSLN
jgi:hypothetical protein